MSFTLDVGGLLTSGENMVGVAADTTKLFSRWYPGAGIYRSVHLVVKPKNHVVPGTMKIVAEPSADTGTVPSTRLVISFCATLREGTRAVGWQMMELTRSARTGVRIGVRLRLAFCR